MSRIRKAIFNDHMPKAVGAYSPAIIQPPFAFISGQIPIDPQSGKCVSDDFVLQCKQVFQNLEAVCQASGGSLASVLKLGVYLTDLANFDKLNAQCCELLTEPYPARKVVEVSRLPKDVQVEIDAIIYISQSLD